MELVKPTDQGEMIPVPSTLLGEFSADTAANDAALHDLLGTLLEKREAIAALEAQLKVLGEEEGNAERAVLEKMIDQGLESFKALGRTVTRGECIRASVRKADRDAQKEWLREMGAGDMIEETVNAATFSGFARELLAGGATLPEFVKVYKEPRLTVRMATAKAVSR